MNDDREREGRCSPRTVSPPWGDPEGTKKIVARRTASPPTGCCPPFEPDTLHEKEITWKYTTCPACAKAHGRNYVLFAQVA
jgi:hypothetical protein